MGEWSAMRTTSIMVMLSTLAMAKTLPSSLTSLASLTSPQMASLPSAITSFIVSPERADQARPNKKIRVKVFGPNLLWNDSDLNSDEEAQRLEYVVRLDQILAQEDNNTNNKSENKNDDNSSRNNDEDESMAEAEMSEESENLVENEIRVEVIETQLFRDGGHVSIGPDGYSVYLVDSYGSHLYRYGDNRCFNRSTSTTYMRGVRVDVLGVLGPLLFDENSDRNNTRPRFELIVDTEISDNMVWDLCQDDNVIDVDIDNKELQERVRFHRVVAALKDDRGRVLSVTRDVRLPMLSSASCSSQLLQRVGASTRILTPTDNSVCNAAGLIWTRDRSSLLYLDTNGTLSQIQYFHNNGTLGECRDLADMRLLRETPTALVLDANNDNIVWVALSGNDDAKLVALDVLEQRVLRVLGLWSSVLETLESSVTNDTVVNDLAVDKRNVVYVMLKRSLLKVDLPYSI